MLVNQADKHVKPKITEDDAPDMTVGAMSGIFLHEVGHALIDRGPAGRSMPLER